MKKHIFIVLFFLAVFGAKAQTPYENYANDGISFDFSKIEDIRFRIYFMYNLQHDGQFSIIQDANDGKYLIFPADNDADLADTFDAYYNAKFTDFSLLSKTDIDEHMTEWKSGIASVDMTSILMDWFLRQSRVDNETCANSLPFCTSETITFEAANTSSTANEPGMDDGCIGSSYNPSFYHMKIRVGGQFIIHMEGHDPINTGVTRDIDFCMWGPYTEAEVMDHSACTNLSSGKIIDCCYSADYTEDCYLGYTDGQHHHNTGHGNINYHLPEVDEYYILMITNYSCDPCVISFSKTPGSGPGETDCGILPGIVTNDGPYCDGETIQLDVNEQPNGTYQWTGPDGWTSTLAHPTRENATVAMSGSYSCTTTVGTETTTATTEVIVSAIPEPTASAQSTYINYGSTTQLNVDPGVQGTFSYHWEPEDMVSDPDIQNPTTVALTSTQQFTVTVINTNGGTQCTASDDITIEVGSGLSVTASADEYELCEGESTTIHAFPTNGTNNYSYSWEPAELLNNPNAQNPVASPSVGTNTFTCHVDDGMVTRDASVVILVHPNAEPYHIYDSICPGDTYYFNEVPYTTATETSYMDHTPFGCDSLVYLHLSLNPTYNQTITIDTCNEYEWNPMGKTYSNYTLNGYPITNETITRNGVYQRTYESVQRCDSVVTINATFRYSPRPSEVYADDTIAPHWVIPSTEFQVNSYLFHVYEQNINCVWDSVTWQCFDSHGNELWSLEPYIDNTSFSSNRYYCKLYVLNHVDDTVTLRATAYNGCEPTGISQETWMVCSFYGTEEQTATSANFNVVPNPNNGEMTLNFDMLTGKVNIKVYNMKGELIDSFETLNEPGRNSMTYSMKQRSAGIYYFVATTKEGTITKKVIVTQ